MVTNLSFLVIILLALIHLRKHGWISWVVKLLLRIELYMWQLIYTVGKKKTKSTMHSSQYWIPKPTLFYLWSECCNLLEKWRSICRNTEGFHCLLWSTELACSWSKGHSVLLPMFVARIQGSMPSLPFIWNLLVLWMFLLLAYSLS